MTFGKSLCFWISFVTAIYSWRHCWSNLNQRLKVFGCNFNDVETNARMQTPIFQRDNLNRALNVFPFLLLRKRHKVWHAWKHSVKFLLCEPHVSTTILYIDLTTGVSTHMPRNHTFKLNLLLRELFEATKYIFNSSFITFDSDAICL